MFRRSLGVWTGLHGESNLPTSFGQKGADVSSSGTGAKKGNCGSLMLVSSRGAENSPIKAVLLPPSSKAFSMWWCLDAMSPDF